MYRFASATVFLPLVALLGNLAQASRPNVLVIITDEHNFRTLGCYREQLAPEQAEMWGKGVVVPTPNIDGLAKQGVLCTRAYATSPVCSPCRAAMVTGHYPQNVGVPTNDRKLDRSIPTIADRLDAAGYRTGFIGKWHLGGTSKPEWAPKIDGGFRNKEFMFNRGHWKKFVFEGGKPAVGSKRNGVPDYGLEGADEETFATDFLTDRAIDYINSPRDESQPFLLFLSYPDPHGPNSVRAPYDHRFDELRFSPPRTYQTGLPSPKWLGPQAKHPPFRGQDMSSYFGMVQCIDDNIGRLIASLEATGQLDNTIIVFTSDHGDLCYEHDRQNKGNPYEGSARVPLIVRYPQAIAAGQIYTEPMGTVDITPTLMGLLQVPNAVADQGRNLAKQLSGAAAHPSDGANSVTFLRSAGTSANWLAAVDSRYKLILSINDDPWLFDNQQDPDELLNYYRRPGTEGVAERLAVGLRDYATKNRDPHIAAEGIAQSLAGILGE